MNSKIKYILNAELDNNIGRINLISLLILTGTVGITTFELTVTESKLDFESTVPPIGHLFVLCLLALASIYLVTEYYYERGDESHIKETH